MLLKECKTKKKGQKVKMAEEIWHHGILGQKWGVRRYQNKDGTLTNKGKIHRNASNKKRVKDMSDDELRSKINRANLEDQYYKASRLKVERGKAAVKEGLKIVGGIAAATTLAVTIRKNTDTISGWFENKKDG